MKPYSFKSILRIQNISTDIHGTSYLLKTKFEKLTSFPQLFLKYIASKYQSSSSQNSYTVITTAQDTYSAIYSLCTV